MFVYKLNGFLSGLTTYTCRPRFMVLHPVGTCLSRPCSARHASIDLFRSTALNGRSFRCSKASRLQLVSRRICKSKFSCLAHISIALSIPPLIEPPEGETKRSYFKPFQAHLGNSGENPNHPMGSSAQFYSMPCLLILDLG